MNFSCNNSLGAVHFDTYLAGKLECASRPPMLLGSLSKHDGDGSEKVI